MNSSKPYLLLEQRVQSGPALALITAGRSGRSMIQDTTRRDAGDREPERQRAKRVQHHRRSRRGTPPPAPPGTSCSRRDDWIDIAEVAAEQHRPDRPSRRRPTGWRAGPAAPSPPTATRAACGRAPSMVVVACHVRATACGAAVPWLLLGHACVREALLAVERHEHQAERVERGDEHARQHAEIGEAARPGCCDRCTPR